MEIIKKDRLDYKYIFLLLYPGLCIFLTHRHLYIMRNTEDLGWEIFQRVFSTGEYILFIATLLHIVSVYIAPYPNYTYTKSFGFSLIYHIFFSLDFISLAFAHWALAIQLFPFLVLKVRVYFSIWFQTAFIGREIILV